MKLTCLFLKFLMPFFDFFGKVYLSVLILNSTFARLLFSVKYNP